MHIHYSNKLTQEIHNLFTGMVELPVFEVFIFPHFAANHYLFFGLPRWFLLSLKPQRTRIFADIFIGTAFSGEEHVLFFVVRTHLHFPYSV